MTEKQRNKIEIYQERYKENCIEYVGWGSANYCGFSVHKSNIDGDTNVTIVMTTITGISNTEQPYVETQNILIESDGSDMDLLEVYPENDVVGYLDKLHKIEY